MQGASVTHMGISYQYPKNYLLEDGMVSFLDFTDKRGAHEYYRQVPGQYRVRVTARGYQDAMQTVQAAPNMTTTITFVLHNVEK